MLQQVRRPAMERVGLRRDAAANVILQRGTLAIVDFRNERDRSETVTTGDQQQLVTVARRPVDRLVPAVGYRQRPLPALVTKPRALPE
jgi:hypothetical protein